MNKPHKTLIKQLLNPFLRLIGYSIVSVFDKNDKFIEYQVRPYPKYCAIIKDDNES